MTMELLIIKSGATYIRVKEDAYLSGGIDKASVYPLKQLSEVQRHAAKLRQQGFKDISIRKLKLTEEPFDD